ncbi:MAG: LysM peptidoglycan-binding domain-containing protein [Bacteroidota bacterium]
MKLIRLILFLLAVGMFSSASGKTIFIEYDNNCMDRYEYRYNGAGYGHIAYHYRISEREKVILEVGIENKVNRPNRPSNTVNCQDLSLNERMVRQINDGDLQIYIVRQIRNGYNISPVGIASYTQISTTFIGSASVDHKYMYNFNQPSNNQNLATGNSESEVYYKGTISFDCPRKFEFERTKKRAGKNYSRMVLIPEIGIIEEATGFNKTDAENNRLILIAINEQPIEQYINGFCSDKGVNYTNSGIFYSTNNRYTNTSPSNNNNDGGLFGMEGSNNNQGNNNGGTTNNNGNNNNGQMGWNDPSTGVSACSVYKDLDRNLYIDRLTGQVANGECGGNTYRNGYMVNNSTTTPTTDPNSGTGTVATDPSGTGTTTPPNTPTPAVDVSNCGEFSGNGYHIVQNNETLYGIARLYGLRVNELKAWNQLAGNLIKPCMKLYTRPQGTLASNDGMTDKGAVHVVKKNETIYQLAKKYGYTADRFRRMNALGNSDVLYVGQRLRISDCNCPAPGERTDIPQPAEYDTGSSRLVADQVDNSKRRIHIVKEDETIYSIARQYSLTVERIRLLNNLEENEIIIPFQRLYVN